MLHAASMLIAALTPAAQFNATEKGVDGEWIKLTSTLPDELLYTSLERAWPRVRAPLVDDFALLLCRSEPDRGVWLHHLATPVLKADYWPGCHDITHWNC